MNQWDEAFNAATDEERKTARRWKPSNPWKWGSALSHSPSGRNQRPTCGNFFSSTSAFDAHRTGPFQNAKNPRANRRCLTIPEMREKGMAQTKDFWWVTKLYENAPDWVSRNARIDYFSSGIP